jgi:hypothetical protein
MSDIPTYDLEVRAADERRRLHSSVVELKDRMRERLDLKRNAREYIGMASGAAAIVSMMVGYALTGMFTRH